MPEARGDVLLFQRPIEGARRRSLAELRARMEVRRDEVELQGSAPVVQEVSSDVAAIVLCALGPVSQEDAARTMGISASLLARQLQNVDSQHLSLQRLWRLDNDFWTDFVVLVTEHRQLGIVRRQVVLDL